MALAVAALALIGLTGCPGSSGAPDMTAEVSSVPETAARNPEIEAVDTGGDVGSAPEMVPETAVPMDAGPQYPAPKCKTFASPWSNQALFVNKSPEYALDEDHLDVLGNRLAAADIDGDGYPDLIVHHGGSHNRDDPENGDFKRRILLNRPAQVGRTFEDFTVESQYGAIAGTHQLGRAAHFAIFADVDNDGDLDAFSATFCDKNSESKVPDRSVVLLNDGAGVFSLAPESDISPAEEWTTSSASFVDFDRDGYVDLWVGNWYYQYGFLQGLQDRLYQGHGDGTFTDVTEVSGLATTSSGFDEGTNHRPTFGVTACDVDGDGDTDLLSSSYGRQFNMLWLNQGDGTFTDASHAVGFASDDNMDFSDNQFYACFCHAFDGDCDPMPPAPAIMCQSNYWSSNDALPWRNGGNTFSTACADLDNDLDLDLYNAEIVHWHIGQSSDESQLLRNDPAENPHGFAFIRPGREVTGMVRPRVGAWNEGDIYAAVFDADGDGLPDIFQPSSDYPDTHGWLFRGLGDGIFEDVDLEYESGLSLQRIGGVTVADFDRDGDLDTVVAFSTMRCEGDCEFDKPVVRMFMNLVNGRANWTAVSLHGKGGPDGANASGIGARVLVTAGGQTQVREVSGGYGHMGMQNTLTVHFGLGESCTIDRLEVHWPNQEQTQSVFEEVPANYFLVVREEMDELEFP